MKTKACERCQRVFPASVLLPMAAISPQVMVSPDGQLTMTVPHSAVIECCPLCVLAHVKERMPPLAKAFERGGPGRKAMEDACNWLCLQADLAEVRQC